MKTIGILAGEPSGDLLGAGLIAALKKIYPNISFVGIGGPAMIAAGCQSLYDMHHLSVMGLVEPLMRLPTILKIRRGIYKYFLENKPDLFIGIDSPDFNLGLELKLRQAGIPVVHYVSPSVWAWRKKRVFKIAKAVDLMLTLLPFEAQFYEQHKVPVKFVGHPLADQIPLYPDKLAARQRLNLSPDKIYIALLPGSRNGELKRHAELFLRTALQCRNDKIEFITSSVNTEHQQAFSSAKQTHAPNLPMHFFTGRSHDVLAACDIVLAASGTVTLEAMLFKKPMVIAYQMGKISFAILKHLVKVPAIGLPNLLSQEKCVPEFIQHQATPETLSAALLNFLNHPEKVKHLEDHFTSLHKKLQLNASETAAMAVSNMLGLM